MADPSLQHVRTREQFVRVWGGHGLPQHGPQLFAWASWEASHFDRCLPWSVWLDWVVQSPIYFSVGRLACESDTGPALLGGRRFLFGPSHLGYLNNGASGRGGLHQGDKEKAKCQVFFPHNRGSFGQRWVLVQSGSKH